MTDQGAETETGRAMFDELLWVHGMIRSDLGVVRRLADDVAAGLSPAGVQAGIDALKTSGPLWRLKINCLRYCRFVHSHHHFEDEMWFPTLRSFNPAIHPVIDRLEEDHRKVSVLLDDVERLAAALTHAENTAARTDLAAALGELATHLLAHLEYEEENAGPTIRRMP